MPTFVEELVCQITGLDDPASVAFINVWYGDFVHLKAVEAYYEQLTQEQQGKVFKDCGLDYGDVLVDEFFETPPVVTKQIKRVITDIEMIWIDDPF